MREAETLSWHVSGNCSLSLSNECHVVYAQCIKNVDRVPVWERLADGGHYCLCFTKRVETVSVFTLKISPSATASQCSNTPHVLHWGLCVQCWPCFNISQQWAWIVTVALEHPQSFGSWFMLGCTDRPSSTLMSSSWGQETAAWALVPWTLGKGG